MIGFIRWFTSGGAFIRTFQFVLRWHFSFGNWNASVRCHQRRKRANAQMTECAGGKQCSIVNIDSVPFEVRIAHNGGSMAKVLQLISWFENYFTACAHCLPQICLCVLLAEAHEIRNKTVAVHAKIYYRSTFDWRRFQNSYWHALLSVFLILTYSSMSISVSFSIFVSFHSRHLLMLLMFRISHWCFSLGRLAADQENDNSIFYFAGDWFRRCLTMFRLSNVNVIAATTHFHFWTFMSVFCVCVYACVCMRVCARLGVCVCVRVLLFTVASAPQHHYHQAIPTPWLLSRRIIGLSKFQTWQFLHECQNHGFCSEMNALKTRTVLASFASTHTLQFCREPLWRIGQCRTGGRAIHRPSSIAFDSYWHGTQLSSRLRSSWM